MSIQIRRARLAQLQQQGGSRGAGGEGQEDQKLKFTFANEVFLNNRWIPIDTNRGYFGERPESRSRWR